MVDPLYPPDAPLQALARAIAASDPQVRGRDIEDAWEWFGSSLDLAKLIEANLKEDGWAVYRDGPYILAQDPADPS